ncbi:hypothetical protein M441DRAFT_57029 [Trichoderma asperellum CBS 433.97]|uniref:Serine protease n=1 Tax=Trichoderma asperellum (strain ATCC 204424 / CBS 433.97 / NBRC 101777) TaxID=1042311 RepID=A0A2T3ZBR6_TRIA4|nr:hypothetical protein M441DRAFT_57029 [Trichoderma asperellum CBS 433.97]PTB42248.1 hypothetical protein M441DRAFT_57029 [Trichoderma asperellum CBS 433.97]
MISRLSVEFTNDIKLEYARGVQCHRREDQQPKFKSDLDKVNFQLRNTIVRLQFDFGGQAQYGTGFFINLPSTKYDVILTAGHNLVNEEKVKVQNLTVLYHGKRKEKVTEFKICPRYEEFLGINTRPPTHVNYDYGVILLPKDEGQADKRLGLGLDLSLNIDPSLQGLRDAFVSGYGDGVGSMTLRTCFSPLKGLGNKIEYYLESKEQGMSGSPIWVTHDGQMTVIGIHNTTPEKKGARGVGTRITEEVFRMLCLWTQSGFLDKRFCAAGGKTKPHNTYLSFPQNGGFASVFLGSSSAAADKDNLTFDIIPAYIFPKWSNRSPLYAFKFRKSSCGDSKKCWVEWQPLHQKAVLVDTLKDIHFVRLIQRPRIKAARYFVLIPDIPKDGGDGQELRLYDNGRDQNDIDIGKTDFEGVSFGEFKERCITGSRTFMIE